MTKPSMCLYPNSKERQRQRARSARSIRGTRGRRQGVQNDKDLFSAMIKYLC